MYHSYCMDNSTIVLLLLGANMLVTLVSLTIALKHFMRWQLLVYSLILTVLVVASPAVSTAPSGDIELILTHTVPGLFVSCILWDSRTFLVDSFTFSSFIIRHPHYLILPISITLALTGVVQLSTRINWLVVVLGCVLGATVTEAIYSVGKRRHLLIPPGTHHYRHRSVSTYTSAMSTPLGLNPVMMQ